MNSVIPPAFIFIVGAILLPFVRGRVRQFVFVLIPIVALIDVGLLRDGISWSFDFLGYEVVLGRVDTLSRLFALIFAIMAFAGAIYALHVRRVAEQMAAFVYVGGALGVVFSGDFISLFVFWELMAFSSVCLIWLRDTRTAQAAGLRYLLVHVFGGLTLLVGVLWQVNETGSIAFEQIPLGGPASYLILAGFLLNAAAPPLHAWLPDSYPVATVSGAVFLSAFTTKAAVYVLARAFAGAELLIWVGLIMALYGIIWAILENDIRRILAYSIINQVGFMAAGIGIGTEMALNGVTAHAVTSILYTALLFMSAGSVLYMTGKSKCTELGGLYKTMPLTMWSGVIGAASISAFPLFSGFISKPMVTTAAAQQGMAAVWLLLTLASAGVFLHAGIKFPYFVFFAEDAGIRTTDPPMHMRLAMGFVAFLCVALGVFPGVLYRILPYPVEFSPYTAGHVVGQLQLLLFSALAFFLLLPQLQRTRTILLDTDWFYRKGADVFLWLVDKPLTRGGRWFGWFTFEWLPTGLARASRNPLAAVQIGAERLLLWWLALMNVPHREGLERRIQKEREIYPGDLIHHWPVGLTVFSVTLFLLLYLVFYYVT